MDKKTQIVVVGGGAGGLELVRRLGAKFDNKKFDVILVERSGTHVWKPLLHEVAAGSLDANLDETGYRNHAFRWGYRFFYGSLESIDREAREVIIAPLLDDDGSELIGRHRIRYDYLVIAVGSVTNDFDTPGVLEHCLVLDERTQADRFRQKLLNHCLRVSRAVAAEPECDAYVDVAIVGGGATGVELAAELYNAAAALRYYGLEVFEEKCLRVTLIEAGPRILPALPEKLAEAAHHELEALGVKVLANTSISRVSEDGLWAQSGDFFPAHLKVWAAGVKGAEFLKKLDGLETNARNQLLVRPTLQTSRDDRIFALGDCCACTLDDGAGQVPPRAQAAHQMATTVFRNLRNLVNDRPLKSFAYRDHGSLVSLSRFSTVGSLMGNLVGGRMAIEGRLAKFVYSSLYRMHLIAIHGWIKGGFLLLVGRVNKVVRPRMKLH